MVLKYLQEQSQALSLKMQPVLLSSLAEGPHTCRVMSQYRPARHLCPQCFATRGRRVARRSGEAGGRERRSLQLQLPSGAVPSEIERKKHFTGQAGDELQG